MPPRIRLKHDRLAALLADSRLSQNHWALKFGISRGHLSDLLKGRHPYISARTRQKLLDVLNVPFDELFEAVPHAHGSARRIRPEAGPDPLPTRSLLEFVMTLIDDVRYALRVSLRYRLVSAAVVVTLAVGIGVTTSVFAVVHAVVLAPLPFPDSDQVIRLGMTLRDGRRVTNLALPDIEDIRQATQTLSDITAVRLSGVALTGDNNPEHQLIAYVDHAYDEVFRVRPLHGRFFEPSEYAVGSPRVVLLMYPLWRDRFGSDPSVIGRTIHIDHQPATVIGVLPDMAYTYPFPGLGLLGPLRPDPTSFHMNRGALWLRAAGRVKPGVTLAQANAEILTITSGIAQRFPDAYSGLAFWTESLRDGETADARSMLLLMSFAVAAVLLVACVNVANLLLSHSQVRAKEFAVRSALGGRTSRLRLQVLTESGVLALAGGALGILMAPLFTRVLLTLYPGQLPRLREVAMNGAVVAVAMALTMLAAVVAGLPLGSRIAKLRLSRDLRQAGRGHSAARSWRGRVLIGAQVALSCALAFASVLLIKTMVTLAETDPGFRTASVASFQMSTPPARYPTAAAIELYFDRASDALAALPGVVGVATATDMPFTGNLASDVFVMKEHGDLGPRNPNVRVSVVSPAYWEVMGGRIDAGLAFTPADGMDAPRVVILNQAAVDKYYGGQAPLGHQIEFNRDTWTIVGVAGPMRMASMTAVSGPQMYLHTRQFTRGSRYFVVRSSGPDAPAMADMRRALASVDPTIPPIDIATLDERLEKVTAPQRFRAVLVSALGLMALCLSALGIYGVLADAVAGQTREIGIRLALGESDRGVLGRVMRQSLVTVCGGLVVGLALALATGEALSSFLLGVEGQRGALLAGVVMLVVSAAVAASYIPARRASRVSPLTALRHE